MQQFIYAALFNFALFFCMLDPRDALSIMYADDSYFYWGKLVFMSSGLIGME